MNRSYNVTYDSSAEHYRTISLSTWPPLDWKRTFSLKHLMLSLIAQWFPSYTIEQFVTIIFWDNLEIYMPKFDESIGIHLSSTPFILLCCQWAANAKKLQGGPRWDVAIDCILCKMPPNMLKYIIIHHNISFTWTTNKNIILIHIVSWTQLHLYIIYLQHFYLCSIHPTHWILN